MLDLDDRAAELHSLAVDDAPQLFTVVVIVVGAGGRQKEILQLIFVSHFDSAFAAVDRKLPSLGVERANGPPQNAPIDAV